MPYSSLRALGAQLSAGCRNAAMDCTASAGALEVDSLAKVHYTPYQDIETKNRGLDMAQTQVSIGQVKRDISDLVNRVAYGGERIVLTSRGKPKAAIVSIEDYERLEEARAQASLEQWRLWLAESDALAAEILARRGGEPLDVDTLWDAARDDLEARDAQAVGG
jgi:prevent-host-death family protein